MAFSKTGKHKSMNKRFLLLIIILSIVLVVHSLFLYVQWGRYISDLRKYYVSSGNLMLEAVESMVLRDIATLSSVVYSSTPAVIKLQDIKYVAYEDGKLWATNIYGLSDSGASTLYNKVRSYMGADPVKVIPRMYLTYNGVVVGYIPSGKTDRLIIAVFSSPYLENMVYRIVSNLESSFPIQVVLFTHAGLPINVGSTFNISVFRSLLNPGDITITSDGIVFYSRGRILSLAIISSERVMPFSIYVIRYLSMFILFAFILYTIYYVLEKRYFAPLDDLQEIYSSYVRSGYLDLLKLLMHRRKAQTYFYPANIMYTLLYELAEDVKKLEGVGKALSGIYSLFSRLSDDFDENNMAYLNKVLENVRDILDVDGVFILVKDGDAYKIIGYAGVASSISSSDGIRVYSKYWDKFFRDHGGTFIEDIRKDKPIKDAMMTGISFMTAFEKAIISTLGVNDMIEGLLVVLIKDATSKDLRMLEDLVSIVSYMLTGRIMLSRLKASSDEIALNSLLALLSALEVKDPYTAGHSNRVALYSRLIAEKMDLRDTEIDMVYKAALLHDMGKEGVPDRILLKPAPLTADEWEYMKTHPITSAAIIEKLGRFTQLIPGILHHHTRYDGGGYPGGLKGKSIPLIARIIAVADAYDAMTTDRPYRHALSDEKALSELIRGKGTQFDPDIVDVFLSLYNDGMVQHVRQQVPSSLSFRSPHIMEKVFRTLDRYMFAVVDINGLHYINNKYGKHIGDKVIDMALQILREKIGHVAEVGRLDGDHIAILFTEQYPSRSEMYDVVELMNIKVKSLVPIKNHLFKVVVIKYPQDLTDRRSILHYASVLLTLAKTMGVSVIFMEDVKKLLGGE